MFRLENITKIYSRRGKEVKAFAATSLEVAKGEYTAIVGPSGSGKTTFLSILGGMPSPDTGHVWLNGLSLYELAMRERARVRRDQIGFVFQTFNLVNYLTALENVQVPLYLAGLGPAEQRSRAEAMLERVGLAERMDHKPSEMSIGQQQRVALARTLANDPTVILADEPTGNLDPESRLRVLAFFDELTAEGRTIVMVTHDAVAAERARQRLTLRDGQITLSSSSQVIAA